MFKRSPLKTILNFTRSMAHTKMAWRNDSYAFGIVWFVFSWNEPWSIKFENQWQSETMKTV